MPSSVVHKSTFCYSRGLSPCVGRKHHSKRSNGSLKGCQLLIYASAAPLKCWKCICQKTNAKHNCGTSALLNGRLSENLLSRPICVYSFAHSDKVFIKFLTPCQMFRSRRCLHLDIPVINPPFNKIKDPSFRNK